MLAYVYVDSAFINKEILENGLGYLYLFKDAESDFESTKQLLFAQQNAIANNRQIWSMQYTPEEYYINKEGSFRLHRPGCASVSKLQVGHYRTFTDRLEGFREGLSPCRNCKP